MINLKVSKECYVNLVWWMLNRIIVSCIYLLENIKVFVIIFNSATKFLIFIQDNRMTLPFNFFRSAPPATGPHFFAKRHRKQHSLYSQFMRLFHFINWSNLKKKEKEKKRNKLTITILKHTNKYALQPSSCLKQYSKM
jgi:hypothetical protein